MRSPRVGLYIERIGANIAHERVARGLTQERLAEMAKIAPRSVQRMERAVQDVSISALVAIADALEISPSALLKPAKIAAPKVGRPRAKKSAGPRR